MGLFGKKTEKDKRVQELSAMSKYMKISGKHQAGLPLPMDMECVISIDANKFLFLAGNNRFELNFEKISDVCVRTDKEIESQYVSSIGGAVAGGMLFGPLGAIVGGRAKEKRQVKNANYLIFTYRNANCVDFISFELGYKEEVKANEIIKYFKSNIMQAGENTVVL